MLGLASKYGIKKEGSSEGHNPRGQWVRFALF